MDDERTVAGDGQGPEPTEIDVDLAIEAQRRLGKTRLRRAEGDDVRCGDCRHFLTPGESIAYCWHPTQRTLVDAGWVCAAFRPDPDR